jgi:type IV secretory pathway VirB4 component
MGETKAGKTTLMYYLLKKKLVMEITEMGILQLKPQALYLNA